MTPTACPACEGPLCLSRRVPAGEPSDPRAFPLWRCEVCESEVTGGPPPGPELYEEGMYSSRRPRLPGLVDRLQGRAAAQPVGMLRRAGLAPGGRVLDVGAGRGRLVAALVAAGYEASGIEPSARSAGLAAAKGLPVARAGIESLPSGKHGSELDAVVLWHVLEHLDAPLDALRQISSRLRPGGLLLVGVPNVASLQAAIAREGWLHLDVPRHRAHHTPLGLRLLLRRAGFSTVSTRHVVWEHNPLGMWMSLLTRVGMSPGFPFHALKRNIALSPRDLAVCLAGMPALPLALALEAAGAALGRGGTIALVARRDHPPGL